MAAQPQSYPSESRNIAQSLLPEFDHEMANTRKSLERVPDNKRSFKPHAKSMTLGGLTTHLATINGWADAIVGMDSFDVSTAPPNSEFKTTAEALAAFDEVPPRPVKAIAGATDFADDEALDAAFQGGNDLHHAARGCAAQLHPEPYHPSPRSVGRLPPLERYSCALNLLVRRRTKGICEGGMRTNGKL